MATTTNYGWTTPDDTALVKDGASAIRSLGSAIDTSLNTALGTKKAGLVLLNTTSFSAVASQSFNNVFSSTYDVYRIVIVANSSTGNNIRIRLRVGGSDNSTASSYTVQIIRGASTTASALRLQDSYSDIYSGDSDKSIFTLDIADPFLAATTSYTGTGGRTDRVQAIMGFHNQSTSYDGFTLFSDTGTFTGKVSIYGYQK